MHDSWNVAAFESNAVELTGPLHPTKPVGEVFRLGPNFICKLPPHLRDLGEAVCHACDQDVEKQYIHHKLYNGERAGMASVAHAVSGGRSNAALLHSLDHSTFPYGDRRKERLKALLLHTVCPNPLHLQSLKVQNAPYVLAAPACCQPAHLKCDEQHHCSCGVRAAIEYLNDKESKSRASPQHWLELFQGLYCACVQSGVCT